jgi:hypothetical protein
MNPMRLRRLSVIYVSLTADDNVEWQGLGLGLPEIVCEDNATYM